MSYSKKTGTFVTISYFEKKKKRTECKLRIIDYLTYCFEFYYNFSHCVCASADCEQRVVVCKSFVASRIKRSVASAVFTFSAISR